MTKKTETISETDVKTDERIPYTIPWERGNKEKGKTVIINGVKDWIPNGSQEMLKPVVVEVLEHSRKQDMKTEMLKRELSKPQITEF